MYYHNLEDYRSLMKLKLLLLVLLLSTKMIKVA